MGGAETGLHPYADSAARRAGMLDSRHCHAAVDALKVGVAGRCRFVVRPASGHARAWQRLVLLVLLLLRREVLTLDGHGRRFRTVVPRQCRVQSFHQGWTWQPRVQRTRVVRKAETTAGEPAGTRAAVFVAVEVCTRTLSDRCLRWKVSTERALGSAWRCRPARRKIASKKY